MDRASHRFLVLDLSYPGCMAVAFKDLLRISLTVSGIPRLGGGGSTQPLMQAIMGSLSFPRQLHIYGWRGLENLLGSSPHHPLITGSGR